MLYQVLKNNISKFNATISKTQKDCLFEKIKDELNFYEDSLADKTFRALQSMNTRLQKEITNFVNLKMRIAFLKSGINNENEIIESSDDFFKSIEE